MSGFRVGLTGGIGSGKSTIATRLEEHGAGIVDADQLVHQLIAPGGAAVEELRQEFGAQAIAADGGIDRSWMRARAFGDAGARRQLEAIVHPRVRIAAEARAAELASAVPYIVLVIPLLVESGDWKSRVHRVLVVDCSQATQLTRVTARPGIDEATARAMVRAQASREARLAVADDVIFNEAPIGDIDSRVSQLHRHYVKCALDPVPRGGL